MKKKDIARIDYDMGRVRKTPKSLEKSVAKVMDFSRYLFFDKESKTAICSECGAENSFSYIKEKENAVCPSCGKMAKFFSQKRKKGDDTRMVLLVQALGEKELVLRYFKVTNSFINFKVSQKNTEVMRTFCDFSIKKVTDYEWYYFHDVLRWCIPQPSIFCSDGLHHHFQKGILHKEGLTSELRKASLEKILLNKELKEALKGKNNNNIWGHEARYIEVLCQNPWLEIIFKSGFKNVAEEYINGHCHYDRIKINTSATNIRDMLYIPNKKILKEVASRDISYEDLAILQKYFTMPTVKRYSEKIIDDILKAGHLFKGSEKLLRYCWNLSIKESNKFIKYISEKEIFPNDYVDYLNSCNKLEYDFSEIVLYPKDFKGAHDSATLRVKDETLKKHYVKIEALLPNMVKEFNYEDENFIIKAPDVPRDITIEGQKMHHCVGTYIEKVAEGKTNILFLRKKTEIDKPFVTVEVNADRHLVQARAFSNGNPTEEVWAFIEKFKKEKKVV